MSKDGKYQAPRYRGRFAPSPTGPLHFGSLVAAVGSFLEARRHAGVWLVRMEDVDAPRVVSGAADDILRALDAFGLHWDETVMYQRDRASAYAQALDQLRIQGALYACACSRREIADSAVLGIDGPVYPGTCRDGLAPGKAARAWRVKVDDSEITFVDRVQGEQRTRLAHDVGDFVVRRADGLYAYQLAVVVDDAAQGITEIVRGADLLDSTGRQLYLQRLLGMPVPSYAHLPVAVNAAGEKLSKQTGAPALDIRAVQPTLIKALEFLGQAPPAELRGSSIEDIWRWAIARWDLAKVPARRTVGASF